MGQYRTYKGLHEDYGIIWFPYHIIHYSKGRRRVQYAGIIQCKECNKWYVIWKSNYKKSTRCKKCNGHNLDRAHKNNILENHYNWKGGRWAGNRGYMHITISCDDPFFEMCSTARIQTGRILEHRYIMAGYLGRCLEKWEQVHHINRDKLDNRIENLELLPDYHHSAVTRMFKENKIMKKRIKELELQLT